MLRFLRSLRGKLILTYTGVTVLALLALEVVVLLAAVMWLSIFNPDRQGYLSDVQLVLYPQASNYLQPGQENLDGLQGWLESVYAVGRASYDPIGFDDSPAAVIAPGSEMLVLAPDGTVLAEAPVRERGGQVGQIYIPEPLTAERDIWERALEGNNDPLSLYTTLPGGDYWMMVPVHATGQQSPVVGIIVVTVQPAPALIFTAWPLLLGAVLGTGAVLLVAVTPFAALFGFIMSRGLTGRLAALGAAADAWSEGDFSRYPQDRAQDEIGHLGRRLRHMAERLQSLLQTQQELAALQERNRLARELHDTVKQQSFATLMQVRAARNTLAGAGSDGQEAAGAAERHLAGAEELIKTSQQELGRLIAELRPAALEGQGLAAAVRAYADTWSAHSRIPAAVQVQNERALSLEIEQALYRVGQEALANVARHSRASAAVVQLNYEPGLVRLVVRDNGLGFEPQTATGGFGLSSMRQRLAALGGTLTVESGVGGTTVTAAVAA